MQPNRVDVAFLQIYFYQIEHEINSKTYQTIITAAINAKTRDKERLLDVCDFLHRNSFVYTEMMKAANIAESNKEPLGHQWLNASFKKNNPGMFRMLLTHGINLSSLVPQMEGTITEHFSSSKLLFLDFCRFYNEIYNDLVEGKGSVDKLSEAKIRILTFINIMLEPQFIAGAEYEHSLKSRLTRSQQSSLLHKSMLQRREFGTTGTVVRQYNPHFDAWGTLELGSILDGAINTKAPDEVISMIIESLNDFPLANLARNIGIMVSEDNYIMVINDDNDQRVLCFSSNAMPFENARHINQCQTDASKVGIKPCIYITPRAKDSRDLPRTAEQSRIVQESYQKLINHIPTAVAKIGNKEFYNVIENLLNSDPNSRSSIPENAYRKMKGDAVGAIIILCKILPPKTYYDTHYKYLLRALLALIDLIDNATLRSLVAFEAKNLIRQARNLGNDVLHVNLLKVLQDQSMSDTLDMHAAPVEQKIANLASTQDRKSFRPT